MRGFAVVTAPSRLALRPAALEWLEARQAAEAARVEAEFPPGGALETAEKWGVSNGKSPKSSEINSVSSICHV